MESRSTFFRESLSPFLKTKLNELKSIYGESSWQYQSIARQYLFSSEEDAIGRDVNLKHYEANAGIPNLERLYKHHACIEINFSCASHCRYCLRCNYDKFVITDEEIKSAIKFMDDNKLDEILITGGDPFLSPDKLEKLLSSIKHRVPSIKHIRIATRVFTQNPNLVNNRILEILSYYNIDRNVEVATQVSSPIELTWPETIDAFNKIHKLGIPVYSQNVFLKGVNDDPKILIELYERMRGLNITPHYLFNCCPLIRIDHFRPSLEKMVECYEQLVNSGAVTGRSKPILALMTSIGKITLTPFNVLEYKKGDYVKLKSRYKLEDRLAYNPNWKMPNDAWVSDDGYLCIKYLDGNDD